MNILDAQSKDASRARAAIMGLLSRGAHIKAFYGVGDRRGWRDFHLVIGDRRYEANRTVLMGIAESGKVTFVDDCKSGFICFCCPNLSMKGKAYTNESC